MASSWEQTQQAFAILQNALRESEARADALDSELKRKRPHKNQLEQQVEVLQHRLAKVEAECEQWKREAGQLDEVAENERAKVSQLRKKLDIAESGPERLTKKEINFWRAKADAFNTEISDYRARIAALMKELSARDAAPPQAGPGETGDPAMDEQLRHAQAERARLEAELEARNRVCTELAAEIERLQHALGTSASTQSEQQAANQRLRETLADRDLRTAALTAEIEGLRAANAKERNISVELRERAEQAAQSAEAHRSLQAQLEERTRTYAAAQAEHERVQERLRNVESELGRITQTSRQHAAERDASAQALEQAHEHIARLETELKEEKECVANLSEVANERRERVTQLEEQLEEAQERHAEAAWRLGKALHFERLAQKRRKLIGALILAIRNRHKANTALKAGLDSLRTHKATAAQNQQKLLKRIDKLTRQLRETEETLKHQHSAAEHQAASVEAEADGRQAELEQRLNAQIELIQSLESELRASKAAKRAQDDQSGMIEQLRGELEKKNQIIQKLESDADEQQRKIAKLRGSESETLRLKAASAQTQEHIDALEQQVTELKFLLEQEGGTERAPSALEPVEGNELQARLAEREMSIAKLLGTIKEHETRIAELSESVRAWRQKYEFLATEEPAAYRAAADK